jgi:hypothetical protein
MPFGYADEYLFYDVELSVLERSIGKFPSFNFDTKHYDDPSRRAARFEKYIEKWSNWFSGVDECEQVSSMYVVRTVLPKREHNDTRPTVVEEKIPGYWHIFSGKIAHSVPKSRELAIKVEKYLYIMKSADKKTFRVNDKLVISR